MNVCLLSKFHLPVEWKRCCVTNRNLSLRAVPHEGLRNVQNEWVHPLGTIHVLSKLHGNQPIRFHAQMEILAWHWPHFDYHNGWTLERTGKYNTQQLVCDIQNGNTSKFVKKCKLAYPYPKPFLNVSCTEWQNHGPLRVPLHMWAVC